MHDMRDETVPSHLRANGESRSWYALCGTRLYCIATLAGTFPDTGWHVPDEMGGVWAPPIKLLDGYWLGVRVDSGETHWLTLANEWQRAADGVTLRYTVPALGLEVTRRDWIVPDESALVLDMRLARVHDSPMPANAMLECGLALRSDLRGIWLTEERLGLRDGPDVAEYHDALRAVTIHDTLHPEWTLCTGAADGAFTSAEPATYLLGDSIWGPERTAGQGTGAALWYRVKVAERSHATLRFVVTGPGRDGAPATSVFSRFARSVSDLDGHAETVPTATSITTLDLAHRAHVAAFRSTFEHCTLHSPNPQLNEAFAWAKVSGAQLWLDVPGLGRAPMGGLPDYPWWFGCDIAYGVLPMLPAGHGKDAADALRTLAALSRRHNDGNGRVVHEVVSNGVVTSSGNLVETLLLARALYHTYRWTGDQSLLDDLFSFCLDGVLGYALGTRLNPGERVPQGESMAETPDAHSGVQTLDVGAYCAEVLDLLGELAGARHDAPLARELRNKASGIRTHMREEWWLPDEGFFGDLRASRAEMEAMLHRFETMPSPDDSVLLSVRRLRDALAAPDNHPPEQRRPWLFLHYVQALAAEAGLPTREQAQALLARLESPEWTEPHGLVLNAATDRRIMSLPTGAMAVAEARYGRTDVALEYIERLIGSHGAATPGTICEFSPDGGCFQQLWSSYGVLWPVVHSFFGLRPDAAARRLVCVPRIPTVWPAARLAHVAIGDTWADVTVERTDGGQRVTLEIGDPTWEVMLGAVGEPGMRPIHSPLGQVSAALRPGQLAERDERDIWLAPPETGAALYTLDVAWSLRDSAAACQERPEYGDTATNRAASVPVERFLNESGGAKRNAT